jgi:hypothetical protein
MPDESKMARLNDWLALIANLGVLLGIFFLIYEIQQNTDAIRSQTRAAIYGGAQEELWKNMEFPDVTLNMLVTDHELSTEEKIRFDAWMSASMRAREFAWIEYRNGSLDATYWESDRNVIAIILGNERGRIWWNEVGRLGFGPEFVTYVDEYMKGRGSIPYVEKVLSLE